MPLNRKLLHINLDSGEIKKEEISLELRRKFLGGRGINTYFLYHFTGRDTDPFSPENPVILGAGLLTGTMAPGAGRMNITARSPENRFLGDSNIGGDFGAELNYTGYSHVVIRGRSKKPVYILIKDDDIEIKDAQHIWGKDTLETQKIIREDEGIERLKIACIGPAGERLVRFSGIVTGRKNMAARTGIGAVMGSKNLKAIAVIGTKGLSVFKPKEFLSYCFELQQQVMKRAWCQALGRYGTPLLLRYANEGGWLSVKNHQQTSMGEEGNKLSAENLERLSKGMVACSSCPVHCRHKHIVNIDGKEFNGEGPDYGALGPLSANIGISDLERAVYFTDLCNLYGIDAMSMGAYIGWAMELYEKGVINEKDLGYPLDWGNIESTDRLIRDVAYREGFGDLLAEGFWKAEVLGENAKRYAYSIKNMPLEVTDERIVPSFALGLATATRGCDHMRSRPSNDVLNLPPSLLEKLYGGKVSPDYRSYEGKARMVWWHELLHAVTDALGLCRFLTAFSSPHAPKFDEFANLIYLATGFNVSRDDVFEIGERIYTTERMYLVREGMDRKDDTLPWIYFEEPVKDGPAKGAFIDKGKFQQMLDEYYSLHGWDERGIPTASQLEKLGLRELIQ